MASGMDQLGMNFTADGSTMSRKEVEKQREKKGECVTCGQKLYERRMFQKVPLTINGLVLNGRCLNCKPLSVKNMGNNSKNSHDSKKYENSKRMAASRAQSSRTWASAAENASQSGKRGSASAVTSSSSCGQIRFNSTTINENSEYGEQNQESQFKPASKPLQSTTESSAAPVIGNGDSGSTTTQEPADPQSKVVFNSVIGSMAADRLAKRMILKKQQNSAAAVDPPLTTQLEILTALSSKETLSSQLKCLEALGKITLTEEDSENFRDTSGLFLIFKAMSDHLDSVDLQTQALKSLMNLAISSDVARSIGCLEGLESIVKTMNHHMLPEIHQLSLDTISKIAPSLDQFEQVLEAGVIPCLVNTMNSNMENHYIQSKACCVITNLTTSSTAVRNAVVQAEGLNAINISMMMHGSHPELIEQALLALRNLCTDNEKNKILVAESGGIDNAIKAMQDHRDEVGVQEKGCWALTALAVNPQNKFMIGDVGGIDVIVRALWVHMEIESLVEWACHALWTLSVDATNRNRIVEVGGITSIVSGMRAHQASPSVQGKACGVFANLASKSDQYRINIVNDEGLDVIIMAMILHPDHQLVQQWAVTALRKIASSTTIEVMKECGVDGVLISAKEKFPATCKNKADYILNFQA